MASRDDAVEKLQTFCALLKTTSAKLQGGTSALESHAGAIDSLPEEMVAQLGDGIQDFQNELGDAVEDAEEAVEKVTTEAREGADSALEKAADDLDRLASDFQQQLDADTGKLDDRFKAAESAADDLDEAADGVESGLGEARDGAESAFDGFDGAVEELAGDAREAQSETADRLQATADAVEGEEKGNVESAADESVESGWKTLGGDLGGNAGDVESALLSQYDEWLSEAQSEAQALIDGAQGALADASQAVEEKGATLAQEIDSTGGVLDQLTSEAGTSVAVFEFGAGASESLTPVVSDLVVAQGKVEDIDRLLNELG